MSIYWEHIEPPPHESFRLLRWREALSDVEICLADGRTTPFVGSGTSWHVHSVVELTFIETGVGSRFVGDHIGPIDPPELLLVAPNVPHYWSGLNPSAGISIQGGIDSPEARKVFPELRQLDPLLSVATRGLLFDKAVARDAGPRMQRMIHATGLARLTLVLELLCELIAVDRSRWHPVCQKPFAVAADAPHSQAISEAIRLVIEHFHEKLTIEDLCEAVKISRATLCRHFKQHTGHTPIGFLNSVRIDHARRLLVEQSLTISEIAAMSGFNNLSNFNRLFVRHTGETPSHYRQSRSTQYRTSKPDAPPVDK